MYLGGDWMVDERWVNEVIWGTVAQKKEHQMFRLFLSMEAGGNGN